MSDDELFDLYLKENETIISSLRAIYNKGKEDGINEMLSAYEVMPISYSINQCDLYMKKTAKELKGRSK